METIRITTPVPGYEVFEIRHPLCSARIARHGAQVMEWAPAGAGPVLYRSPISVLAEGKAIRGGIPVCWPWFNAHPADPAKPSHGIARNRFWSHAGSAEAADGVTLRFALEDDERSRELWPHGFRAELEIRCGRELEVRLITRNRSGEAFSVSGALHTYLATGDPERVTVEGLEACGYTETVGPRRECSATGDVLRFAGETDRIYHHAGTCSLVDPILGRRIVVEKQGSPSTVVWNPWAEKAAALADLPDDGFRHFVCIEAAIANERQVVVAPGGEHLFATRIAVTPL